MKAPWAWYRLLQESIRNKISATRRVDSLPVICCIRACRWPRSLKSLNYPRRVSTNPGVSFDWNTIEYTKQVQRNEKRDSVPFLEICFDPIHGLIIDRSFNFLLVKFCSWYNLSTARVSGLPSTWLGLADNNNNVGASFAIVARKLRGSIDKYGASSTDRAMSVTTVGRWAFSLAPVLPTVSASSFHVNCFNKAFEMRKADLPIGQPAHRAERITYPSHDA